MPKRDGVENKDKQRYLEQVLNILWFFLFFIFYFFGLRKKNTEIWNSHYRPKEVPLLLNQQVICSHPGKSKWVPPDCKVLAPFESCQRHHNGNHGRGKTTHQNHQHLVRGCNPDVCKPRQQWATLGFWPFQNPPVGHEEMPGPHCLPTWYPPQFGAWWKLAFHATW